MTFGFNTHKTSSRKEDRELFSRYPLIRSMDEVQTSVTEVQTFRVSNSVNFKT